MTRTDILDAKGRLIAWRVEVFGRTFVRVGAGRRAADDDDDGKAAERLPAALEAPGIQEVPGEWSADWVREAGLLNAAELLLFPERTYAELTSAERNLCAQFAHSWGVELVPRHFIDGRTGAVKGVPRASFSTLRDAYTEGADEDDFLPIAA